MSSRHSERSPLRGCFTFTHRGVLKRNLFWVYVTNLCQFNFSPFAPLFATKSSVILENLSQCKLWVGAVGTVFTSVFNIASSVSYETVFFLSLSGEPYVPVSLLLQMLLKFPHSEKLGSVSVQEEILHLLGAAFQRLSPQPEGKPYM